MNLKMGKRSLAKYFILSAVTGFLFFGYFSSAVFGAASGREVRIYLPREVTVDSNEVILGEVGIVRCGGSVLSAVSKVLLGRFSVAGQQIVINRPTILSRLASEGISGSEVEFTGAEEVTVKQPHRIISSDKFIKAACDFIKKNPPNKSVCGVKPVGRPSDFVVVSDADQTRLLANYVNSGTGGCESVRVVVYAGGRIVGSREIRFELKYKRRRSVSLVDIPAGGIISSKNIKIEEVVSDTPEPKGWSPPYGLIAKRRLEADRIIESSFVEHGRLAVVVERRQSVTIRAESTGLVVTASGEALEQGRVGECIKVRNTDSKRIVLARVKEDGTVEPVL